MKPLANILLLLAVCTIHASEPCIPRSTNSDSVLCVCNSTYCDTVPEMPALTPGMYAVYTSSRSGDRFNLTTAKVTGSASSGLVLEVNKNKTRQAITGFGGAFTDAAGINIASLPKAAQVKLIQAYFASDGLEYNIGRIPMASCDFSTHPYSYDDVDGDLQLSHFALAPEDLKFKVRKFIQEYGKHGIALWGLTTQNEPVDGNIYRFPFQAMGWTPEMQRDFVKLDLGPALDNNSLQHIALMIMDDQRLMLPHWATIVYSDPQALQYVSGVAVHWYLDSVVPINVLDFTHDLQPDRFIFGSEACNGDLPWEPKVILGGWERGEKYASDIIGDLNHWVTGWTDWNLALDPEGGPNWVKNFVDSPIIVNASSAQFYKQPMFYALGHFSKFLVPGSKHVDLQSNIKSDIDSTIFVRPDGSLALVLLNRDVSPVKLSVHDPDIGYLDIKVAGKSIKTVLWRSKSEA